MLHLLHRVLHDGAGRLPQAGEQIAEAGALVSVAVDDGGDVLFGVLRHQRTQPLRLRPADALAVFQRTQHVFQQIVEERADLRRFKFCRFPLPGPEAILHEISEMAGLDLVQPGGRHGHRTAVQAAHRLRRQPSPAHSPGRRHAIQHCTLPVFPEIAPQRTLRAASRQRQRRSGQLTAVAAGLLLHLYRREQLPYALHHKGRQQSRSRLVPGGPRHRQALRGLGQRGVDVLQLAAQVVEIRVRQGDALLLQKLPLLAVQNARVGRHRGQHAVVGPQQEQVLHRVAVVPGQRGDLHLVQRSRDGGHGVLAQRQPQQPRELLAVQLRIAQPLHELIQHLAEDVPQLGVLLRRLHIAALLQRLRPLLQYLRRTRQLRKRVKHFRLTPCSFMLLQAVAQLQKQRPHLTPHPVDLR